MTRALDARPPSSAIARARALALKEWWQQRGSLPRILGMILFGCLLLPGGSPLGYLIVGFIFAMGFGLQIGGSEAANGRLEFLYTRAIDPRWFVRTRYALGLLVLLTLCAVFALTDLISLHDRFWFSLSELPVRQTHQSLLSYPLVTAFLVFVYSLSFALGASASSPRSLKAHGGTALGITFMIGGAALQLVGALIDERVPEDVLSHVYGPWLLSALFLGLAFFLFLAGQKRLVKGAF